MHIQLALLSGISDVHLLWLLGLLSGLTMMGALATDYLRNWVSGTCRAGDVISPREMDSLVSGRSLPSTNPYIFRCGYAIEWVCLLAVWSVIGCYLCFAATHDRPSGLVWAITSTTLVWDVLVAIAHYQQHLQNDYQWIRRYEVYFAGLSLVSKQSLAWMVYQKSRAAE
jgi:hypothetical protein